MIRKVLRAVKVRNIARCALMVALMVLCAWLAVPFGYGMVTLQTLGVFLALGLLGGRQGLFCIGVYLSLGAVGMPVFAGFQTGAALLGPTGGFLWGFLLGGLVFLLLEKRLPLWMNFVLCQLICYLCGVLWFACQFDHSLLHTLGITLLPYLIPDTLKLLLSLYLTKKLHPIVRK